MVGFLKSAIDKIYRKNDDFIFIGLTGSTGSGCSTVAEILKSDFSIFENLPDSPSSKDKNLKRKDLILEKSLNKTWTPFHLVQVRSVITRMLACVEWRALKVFLSDFMADDKGNFDALVKVVIRIRRMDGRVHMGKIDYIDFYTVDLPILCNEIKDILGPGRFVALYQKIGKNIRFSGSPIKSDIKEGQFFALAEELEKIVKKIVKINRERDQKTCVVVDAIRSPLEVLYFQDRYQSFYLMAVSCDEDQRKSRLRALEYLDPQIEALDAAEGTGRDFDSLDYYAVQDIPSCLQRADIYLYNPNGSSEVDKFSFLKRQLIRFVALMHRPGVVTPDAVERCMQIAYTAKLNSGCISRQVGAVVTGQDFSVKAVGWNDVPKGHVPCNLRNRFDLITGKDGGAYSDYEKNNKDFVGFIKSKSGLFTSIIESGRNTSYCFKAEFNEFKDVKNQVHTRALHAEENAFLQISKYGGQGVEGGYLFSTASPCELCAKKTVQLGVTKIFYVDPYPGISESHIINGGSNRPEMILFTGAVGRAFHNLYSPVLPYKDELTVLSG